MRNRSKGHAALRKGRISATGSFYFLTLCLDKDQTGLDSPVLFKDCCAALNTLEIENSINFICLINMPDHLHAILNLHGSISLSRVIRLFKGRMSPVLRRYGVRWQRGYYDRRLRETDPIGVVLRYMLINPYREKLIPKEQKWPYWFCTKEAKKWMSLDEDVPDPEWLNR